jgi:N-[(2S)-2-amino-2-carboxyethyl]-L-glutamate dehydrogenase
MTWKIRQPRKTLYRLCFLHCGHHNNIHNQEIYMSIPKNTIRFLSMEDVIECGGADIQKAALDIRKGFELLLKDEVLQPMKTTLKVNKKGLESSTGLVNFLPAYVNKDGDELYGCKALGAMPANAELGLPRAQGIITLFSSDTKSPMCVMDAQVISATRTGAVTCLAAQKLARKDTEEIGMVGSGVNMRTQLLGLKEALPNLRRVKVFSRTNKKEIFADEMSKRTGLEIIPTSSAEEAVSGCDLYVTCLPNVTSPVVMADWVKKEGVTVINIGCYESEARLLSQMDRVVADIWEQGKHRGVQTHAVAIREGFFPEEKVEDLAPIVTEQRPGRTSDDENIFFAPTGLGFEDVIVAGRIFEEAVKRGIGTDFPLWKSTKWI